MSLSDELAAEEPAKQCVICDWLATVDDADRATFNGWLDEGKPVAPLYRACTRQGLASGETALRRHVARCR